MVLKFAKPEKTPFGRLVNALLLQRLLRSHPKESRKKCKYMKYIDKAGAMLRFAKNMKVGHGAAQLEFIWNELISRIFTIFKKCVDLYVEVLIYILVMFIILSYYKCSTTLTTTHMRVNNNSQFK